MTVVGSVLWCGSARLSISAPIVMGVLNVTPDSFSDGGRFVHGGAIDVRAAVETGVAMAAEGAAIVDVGGESTRPGAKHVDLDEELRRVIPVVEGLAARDIIVSVDTSKPRVARLALDAGARMINDVRALTEPDMLAVVAESEAAVCLMHMRGRPETMQNAPHYDDVLDEVRAYLGDRADRCRRAGIAPQRIVVDPGFGFGKSLEHNLTLLRGLRNIADLGFPVLVGLSRKRTIGALTGRAAGERLGGSIAAAIVAVQNGARIVRAHDVAATVDAINVVAKVMEN